MRRILRGVLGAGLAGAAFLWAIFPVTPERATLTGAFESGTLRVADLERRYQAYLPRELPKAPALLFAIHGSGMDPESLRLWTGARFAFLADREGFLVVYPEGFEHEWNGCRAPGVTEADKRNVDDVGFHLALIERFAASHGIDRARVYAAGVSNGGQMAYRLANDVPERFAAVAAVIANIPAPENSKCQRPGGPISVLIMNGTADPIVPYEGGIASLFGLSARGRVLSARESVAHWTRVNGIRGEPHREQLPDLASDDGGSVLRETWRGSGREVVLYTIRGGGHAIPGGVRMGSPWLTGGLLGRTNQDIHGADEIQAFFGRHSGAGDPP